MRFEKINQILTLLANLGVIAGIVFLAVEVQQNTSMMEAQTRDSMSDKLIDWQMSVATDMYTAETFDAGNTGNGFDNRAQEISYYMLVSANFRIWENEYYQYKKGLFEEAEFPSKILQLEPGDRLVLYSDGVSEAASFSNDRYGEQRLGEFVQANRSLAPAELHRRLIEEVAAFTQGAEQADDLTVLILGYEG